MSSYKVLATLLMLLIGSNVYSQQLRFGNFDVYNNYMRGDYNKIDYSNTVIGSPFMEDSFRLGFLHLQDNDPIAVPLRYNIVEEKFQVRIEEDYFLVEDNIVVELDGSSYKKYQYKQGKSNTPITGYFRILTKNPEEKKLLLLEKPLKIVKKGQDASAMKTATPARYKEGTALFLKFSTARLAVEIPRKLKSLLEFFPNESRENLRTYIKKNKLKSHKVEDLQLIVTYYNSSN